jgi:excisionase family DNA binding protein
MGEQLTAREAANALGLSVHTVRTWMSARKLGYVRLGRAVRIRKAEVDRLIAEGSVPALERERVDNEHWNRRRLRRRPKPEEAGAAATA